MLQPAPVISAPMPIAPPVPVSAPITMELSVPVAASLPAGDAAGFQSAVVDALQAAGQGSAADAFADATWTVGDGEARVQTQLSKTMLPFAINPEAEKLALTTLRAQGLARMALLPGVSGAAAGGTAKAARAPRSGSAQAKAMQHPMVQQAQRLFDAEIQTVIDLSGQE